MIFKFFKERKLRRIESRQQIGEDIYSEVVKSFPKIKEKEIKIIYIDRWHNTGGYKLLTKEGNKKEPRIILGADFFKLLSKEQQEAVIAHEIGHHERMKNYTIPRLKSLNKLTIMHVLNLIPDSHPKWEQRLKKWYILNENAANNYVAKTKYGKSLLESYKNQYSPSNEIVQELITNLENKIKNYP